MYNLKKTRSSNFSGRKNTSSVSYPKKYNSKNKVDISKYTNQGDTSKEPAIYQSKNTFHDFGINPELLKLIEKAGYTEPTEIQDKSIEPVLNGNDLIGIAGTGTGKTAAFLIPVIQDLIQNPVNYSRLIITPTRELAHQISDEFRKLSKGLKLFSTTLIGGTNVGQNIKALKGTNHIIIGTPGRLLDMAERNCLPLNKFNTLVLDEFDRMLDMGFKDDIRKINNKLSGKKQTLLFSATMDQTQKYIVSEMTGESPVTVNTGTSPQKTNAIKQEVVHVSGGKKKIEVLRDIISGKDEEKILLFCETKHAVKEVCKNLKAVDIKADVIHGDITQNAREIALKKFKKGQTNVLIGTDVVARGIDVTDVSLVINHEVPRNYNDYIHRIGRTGRAGKTGKAITLID